MRENPLNYAEFTALAVSGLVAGGVNAVAGGGSLISFPTLLALGYSPIVANVTNGVATVPGYAGGSFGYSAELKGQARTLTQYGAVAALGAVTGSALLLASSDAVFRAVVPWLVIGSAALLAVQPRLTRDLREHGRQPGAGRTALALTSQFAVAVYGGYFAAGLGILMLAVLGFFVPGDLHRLNALKGVLSLVVGSVSAAWFGLFGPVQWPAALVMAITGLIGGLVGVRHARRLAPAVLRRFVVGIGLLVGLALVVTR